MIVGGCRSVFRHLLTTKVRENRPWIRTCACGELQVAATTSKGVILGKVSFLVSRLPESGKNGAYSSNLLLFVSSWLWSVARQTYITPSSLYQSGVNLLVNDLPGDHSEKGLDSYSFLAACCCYLSGSTPQLWQLGPILPQTSLWLDQRDGMPPQLAMC